MVPSGKKFTFELIFFKVIYVNQKEKGARTERWGTPDSITEYSELIPLSETRCFLFWNLRIKMQGYKLSDLRFR